MADWLGYAASAAVLATFLMRSMVPLRLIAVLSNILFLSYGYLEHIHPVFLLHAALLPINLARLATHRTDSVLNRRHYDRIFSAVTGRIRHIALFILGLTAGSLGMRTLIYFALAFITTSGGASFERRFQEISTPNLLSKIQFHSTKTGD